MSSGWEVRHEELQVWKYTGSQFVDNTRALGAAAGNAGMARQVTESIYAMGRYAANTVRNAVRSLKQLRLPSPGNYNERTYPVGEVLPDGRIAGDGPGAALINGLDFAGPKGGVEYLPSGVGSKFRDVSTGRFINPVITETNQAFFWSGRSGGVGGADVARQMAEGRGGITLEAIIEKRGIRMPVWDPDNPSSMQAWSQISRKYAASASGEVRAVIGSTMRPGSVWEMIELPALRSNPYVSRIVLIDPLTSAESILLQR
jgi:hypothetical protein